MADSQRDAKAKKMRGPLARGETMRQQLAKELVVSLFSKNPFSVLSSDEEEPEWKCKECGMFNFATRKMPTVWGGARRIGDPGGGEGSRASPQSAGKGPSTTSTYGETQKGGTPKAKGKGKGKRSGAKGPNTDTKEG